MIKIAAVSILFLFMLLSIVFTAPLIINPVTLDNGKFMFYGASDSDTLSNNINSLFTLGIRYGISDGNEIGLRILSSDFSGVMGDFKTRVLKNDPFTVTFDAGLGFTADSYVVNIAFYLDAEIDRNFAVFIAARGTYPANDIIDTTDLPTQGFVFSPRVGLELFRGLNFSLIIEGGVVMSWYSPQLDYNAAALAGFKI